MLEVFSTFLGCVIHILTSILFAKLVSKLKFNKKIFVIILTILVTSLCLDILVYKLYGIIKTILTLLLYITMYKFIFNISWKKSLFLSIMYVILLLLPDLIILLFATSIINVDMNYFYNDFVSSFYATLLVSVILLIICYIFRNFLNKILNIRLEKNTKIIIISGLVLLGLAIMFYHSFSLVTYNLETLVMLIIIVIFIIILFSLIKERVNNDNLKEQYDKLLEFMVTYEKEVEEQRILRHENKNNLIAIKSKIIDKDNEKEIVSYIDELLNISTKVKNEKYAKFGYLPSNGLKGLFYYKTDEAENKGIKVSISISKDIKKSVISNMDARNFRLLGNIVGVFLDNAIEAGLNSDDKKMGIEIYKNKRNIEILISNSYSNKIDKKKIGFISYSTKGKNRGHGLLLVNSIIKSNKMFENEKIINNEIFTQKLIVKKLD